MSSHLEKDIHHEDINNQEILTEATTEEVSMPHIEPENIVKSTNSDTSATMVLK